MVEEIKFKPNDLQLKAYVNDRTPQLGLCNVTVLDFERRQIELSNGRVRTMISYDDYDVMLFIGAENGIVAIDRKAQEEKEVSDFDRGTRLDIITAKSGCQTH